MHTLRSEGTVQTLSLYVLHAGTIPIRHKSKKKGQTLSRVCVLKCLPLHNRESCHTHDTVLTKVEGRALHLRMSTSSTHQNVLLTRASSKIAGLARLRA